SDPDDPPSRKGSCPTRGSWTLRKRTRYRLWQAFDGQDTTDCQLAAAGAGMGSNRGGATGTMAVPTASQILNWNCHSLAQDWVCSSWQPLLSRWFTPSTNGAFRVY